MSFCKHRVMDKCDKDNRPCIFNWDCFEPKNNPMTNADRIRAMSDEELRFVLVRDCPKGVTHEVCSTHSCENCWLWWLQQPAED